MKRKIISNKGISIGANSKTLLNLLIGANDEEGVASELNKIEVITNKGHGIDIITDLSLYTSKKKLWDIIANETPYMAGTVPIYLATDNRGFVDKKKLLEVICEQCEKGVSIITTHPTATMELIDKSKTRMIPCTSRGGKIVVDDMLFNGYEENVYIQIIDEMLKICKKNGVIISIGSTFRSATIIDAMDNVYLSELQKQLELADYLEKKGAYVIIETPGHVDPRKLLSICDILCDVPYPIMPLGPMPTDVALDEDDTAAVIGASLMGTNNCADILSIVTCREHLSGIPDISEIIRAIKKYNIAKHIIDLYKIGDKKLDYEVSQKRAKLCSCDLENYSGCVRCGIFCPLR